MVAFVHWDREVKVEQRGLLSLPLPEEGGTWGSKDTISLEAQQQILDGKVFFCSKKYNKKIFKKKQKTVY